jgi:hypothetical protein
MGEPESLVDRLPKREVARLVGVACTDQGLLLARRLRPLYERPELRHVSVAAQLDQGNPWGV